MTYTNSSPSVKYASEHKYIGDNVNTVMIIHALNLQEWRESSWDIVFKVVDNILSTKVFIKYSINFRVDEQRQ